MQPRYPIYIVSKGRWDRRLHPTMNHLDRMGIDYRVVVEEQEAGLYAESVGSDRVLILDPIFQRDYDACMTLEPGQSPGSGPARNFAWEHARDAGHARYWCVDDNISGFYRYHQNRKVLVIADSFFCPMEDFIDRYTNVAMAGPHYETFVHQYAKHPPFILNSRIYSCNLIQTNLPFRWRGRYNEDTILSLDLLKAGFCTILFVAFLQNKLATQSMGGGNTAELYANGTLAKSRMLVQEHPDVSRVVQKWNRWHHHVDYSGFKRNRLIRRPDVIIPEGVNEYGMQLVAV